MTLGSKETCEAGELPWGKGGVDGKQHWNGQFLSAPQAIEPNDDSNIELIFSLKAN